MTQVSSFLQLEAEVSPARKGRRGQLLKWIGNKQRYAADIVSHFPREFGCYFEPFLGSGAVLAELKPKKAFASDTFNPLIQIWQTLQANPNLLKSWYAERYNQMMLSPDRVAGYEKIKRDYNNNPNPADLVFVCRACYGGVVRFRKADGYMSTPCGIHTPISPESFAQRVDDWSRWTSGAKFSHSDYKEAFKRARTGDVIYCDPPYSHSQAILYGAQSFLLVDLFEQITRAKQRGVYVALSIDGSKKSGEYACHLPVPKGLFKREVEINCGRSMLKRFQMGGRTLESEIVMDRLLLTF